MSRATLCALLAFAGSALAQEGDEWTVRVRSLAPFAVPLLQLPSPIHTAIPGGDVPDALAALDARGETSAPSWVVGLLTERHRTAIAANRLQVELLQGGKSVLLRGRATDVAACQLDLDALAAVAGRPIEVSAWRLPLGDGPLPSTVLRPAELQQVLQHTPPLWTARGRTRSGGALRLASERGIGYLRDLDTEVAEAAKIFDPKVDLARAGVRATVVVDALPGDELVLRGSWFLSEPVALHEQDVGGRALSVDLPEHRTAWVSFGGRVASGGALAVAGRGGPVGPGGFLLVLGARYLAPLAGDPAPDLLVRPIGALPPAMIAALPRRGWRVPGDDSPVFGSAELDGGIGPGELLAAITPQENAEIGIEGSLLVVHGNADACRQCDALLQQLAAELRPVALHTRAGTDGEAALELAQPLLADRAAGAFLGRERAVVRDQEVEIASRANAGNPVIGVAASGLWFGATAARSGDGWHVAGTWSLAAHDEPRVRIHADREHLTLQLVDYRTTTLPWDAAMAANQEHTLGDGPAWTKDGASTRVTVRLIAP